MLSLASILVFALTRAELIERFKAPVLTQNDGLVQVYANCPEDMRREYQMPIASFASETVKQLYQGMGSKRARFKSPGIIIHVGDVRTNDAAVVSRVTTNDAKVVTRIYVVAPGYADVTKLRTEVVRGFYRAVKGVEMDELEAMAAFRKSDPNFREWDERQRLEDWLKAGKGDDEEGLKLMRKIIAPGKSSVRDVLTFASRLYLYPPQYDLRFAGRFDQLSFREAIRFGKVDSGVQVMAAIKANELMVFGGGRSRALQHASDGYREFLIELAKGEKEERELSEILDEADIRLNVALEEARKYEKQQNHH